MKTKQIIADNLKRMRGNHSRLEWGAIVGVNPVTIKQWENPLCHIRPTPNDLTALLAKLNEEQAANYQWLVD